jgi:hypothetical protein
MPTPKVVRRRRAIKAGFGLLLLSLLGAILARLYLMRPVPQPHEKVAALTGEGSQIPELAKCG